MSNKAAIVTGASRGIGRACAKALAASGIAIYLAADGSREELEEVATQCTALHPRHVESRYGMVDLARPEAAQEVVDAAQAAFGRIDVLVNNAGIRIRKPFGSFTAEDFDRIMAVDLRAAFLLSQAVLPGMRAAGGGRIIHMASQLGMVADPGAAIYGMTKAALIQLTRNMALELVADNIIVNAVSPGPIMTDYYRARLEREPGLLEQRLGAIPAGRLGTEEEIAAAVTFLATTDATFLLGHNLVVDGGFTIH